MDRNDRSKKQESLVHQKPGTLSHAKPLVNIGALEKALLEVFPATTAESWDRTGLIVGEKSNPLKKVAFSLDPTVSAIKTAHERGANVLVTHHPAFIDPPDSFSSAESVLHSPGAGVWAAIENDVALMSFHTSLDVSKEAARVLPKLLNLKYVGLVQVLEGHEGRGYGQISSPCSEEQDLTLEQLSARCVSVFGKQPRVWGNMSKRLERIVTCTGSAGGIISDCIGRDVDCLVCGEIKYHTALELSEAGIAVIDLGHDVSEWPLVGVLVTVAREQGLNENDIVIIDQQTNWSNPESTRV